MRDERGEMMEERCGVLGRDEREGVRDEGCYYLLIDVLSPSHLSSVLLNIITSSLIYCLPLSSWTGKFYNLLIDLLSPPLFSGLVNVITSS